MTNEERRLALYCLKANSNLHGEICEKCSQYPECDHFIQDNVMEELIEALEQQPQTFEWCHDCSEYNHDKHCCSRYNNVIRNAVEEMKQSCEDTISREDAIGAVANLFEMSEYPHPYPQGKPIRLKDIKEKLKQLPSVQPKPIECEDAISRQAAIDALDTGLWGAEWDKVLATAMLKDLPPVQPKPKTGQWVLLDECSNSGYYCSECHKKLVKEGWSGTVKKIKYCPNCGSYLGGD